MAVTLRLMCFFLCRVRANNTQSTPGQLAAVSQTDQIMWVSLTVQSGLEGPDLDPLHSSMRYKKTNSCSDSVASRRDRSTSSNRSGVFKNHTQFHIWQARTFYHSDPTWCPQRLRLVGRPRAQALFPHMAHWITPVLSAV